MNGVHDMTEHKCNHVWPKQSSYDCIGSSGVVFVRQCNNCHAVKVTQVTESFEDSERLTKETIVEPSYNEKSYIPKFHT